MKVEFPEVKMSNLAKLILAIGSATSAILVGLDRLGMFPWDVTPIGNALMLFMLSGVLFAETFYENKRYLSILHGELRVQEAIMLALSIISSIFAVIVLFNVPLSPQISGFLGGLYFLLAIAVIVEAFSA